MSEKTIPAKLNMQWPTFGISLWSVIAAFVLFRGEPDLLQVLIDYIISITV